MSWNNNGNNGSRDPWGGKDGPPDIDEALKKFRDQFSFLFGKKSSSGGGGFNPRKYLTSSLAVISILYGALGIYTVDATPGAVGAPYVTLVLIILFILSLIQKK